MKKGLTYNDCRNILEGEHLPSAFVDLDAFDSNMDKLLAPLEGTGKTMRIASKSVRCVGLLDRLFERGGETVRGIMSYSVEEAQFLSGRGFDDLLVAYPTVQPSDLDILAAMTEQGVDVSLVIDCEEHVRAMSDAGNDAGVELQAVIEVDMSYRPAGVGLHVGVRRSTVRSGQHAVRLARLAQKLGGVKVTGVMGYEAQIAGLTDRNPFTRGLNPVKYALRQLSKPDVKKLRSEVVRALEAGGHELKLVNGGGTGSVDFTGGDDSVTEVSAGSGFYCPHLFSYYSNLDLSPAAFFSLQVVRRPAAGMVACQGGGYVASGEIGPDRLPVPYLPEGGELLKIEGAGEVQTPVVFRKNAAPGVGDPVVFRHAKAGELCERFNELLLVSGGEVTGRTNTYRGDGKCFI